MNPYDVLPAGARVGTPYGAGTVCYVRFADDFKKAAAYSVYLDSRANDPSYSGTIVATQDVQMLPADAPTDPLVALLARRIAIRLGDGPGQMHEQCACGHERCSHASGFAGCLHCDACSRFAAKAATP